MPQRPEAAKEKATEQRTVHLLQARLCEPGPSRFFKQRSADDCHRDEDLQVGHVERLTGNLERFQSPRLGDSSKNHYCRQANKGKQVPLKANTPASDPPQQATYTRSP